LSLTRVVPVIRQMPDVSPKKIFTTDYTCPQCLGLCAYVWIAVPVTRAACYALAMAWELVICFTAKLFRKGQGMDETFEERLAVIRERVAQACARAGRKTETVNILTVSKTHGPERVCEAAACGLTVFGENKVQEAKQKIPLCPGHLVWHLVGHLQTNKVKDAVRLFARIHSVDSLKLLGAIDDAGEITGRVMPVFLEVNVSGESSKFGMAPDEVPVVLNAANEMKRVEVAGLMTIPPAAEDPEHARPYFRRLRELRDGWRQATGFALDELSMGMSHDFEVAIEEGASWIRLGTVLFGSRSVRP